MGLFKKLFGVNSTNDLKEDGTQQLASVLQHEVSTYKPDALWVVGEAVGSGDIDAVFVLLADIKFCYLYRISATNGMLYVSDAVITSEEELTGLNFNDDGNRLRVHFDSINGTADISIVPNVCRVLGNIKIVKSQDRELRALKNIIFPNYRAMCQDKKINKNSFTGVRQIVKDLPVSVRKNIKEFIDDGNMIQAIKLLREVTGYGLAEAKKLAERQDFYQML